MERMSVIGVALSLVGIVVGFLIEKGNLWALLNPSSAVIVLGATIGAVMLSYSTEEIKCVPFLLKKTFREEKYDFTGLIERMEAMALVARREGLLALEKELESIEDPFIHRGVTALIDGIDSELIAEMLEHEINAMEERHQRRAKMFDSAGGYSPTMGIMGTVLHMITIMAHLDKPDQIGPAIGAAFTATLYGVAFANVIYFPIAEKLRGKSKEEILYRTLALEGILSIQQGINPTVLKEKLSVFLAGRQRNDLGGSFANATEKEAQA